MSPYCKKYYRVVHKDMWCRYEGIYVASSQWSAVSFIVHLFVICQGNVVYQLNDLSTLTPLIQEQDKSKTIILIFMAIKK